MTQKDLILDWVREYGSIVPAKMISKKYKEHLFGSDTPRACRLLRAKGKLQSEREGKFQRFYLRKKVIVKEISLDQLVEERRKKLGKPKQLTL